jgi:hypothetical protein
LGFVFTCDDGSATIGVVMFVTKSLGFVIQFYFPESYERLEEIVRMYPANKLDILNTNTTFIIRSEDSKGALKIRAITHINIKIQAINCPRCIRVYPPR